MPVSEWKVVGLSPYLIDTPNTLLIDNSSEGMGGASVHG